MAAVIPRSVATAAPHLLNPFAYRRAIVRALSPAFAASALRSDASLKIDQIKAEQQHKAYVEALKKVVPEVIELPPSELPDSCFVEDTAVVLGDVALITNPGADSRKKEVDEVEAALKSLSFKTFRAGEGARLDGGDVLFTGEEIFVGISGRTNAAGVAAVQRAFPGLPVTPIFMAASPADTGKHQRNRRRELSQKRQALLDRALGKGNDSKASSAAAVAAAHARGDHSHCNHGHSHSHSHAHSHPLHLKSVMSVIGPGSLAVSDDDFGRAIAFAVVESSKRTDRRFHQGYQILLTPDTQAANAVFANGVLIHRAASEFPESAAVFREHLIGEGMIDRRDDASKNHASIGLDMSELAKADGALTCCSLLLH